MGKRASGRIQVVCRIPSAVRSKLIVLMEDEERPLSDIMNIHMRSKVESIAKHLSSRLSNFEYSVRKEIYGDTE